MTEAECVREVTTLRRAFPNANVPQETLAVYVEYLQDIDLDEFRAAVVRVISTCKFFPTIAELRRSVADARMADVPGPQEAWCQALDYVCRRRGKENVHPLVAHCVARIGERKIGDGGQELSFIRLYSSLREKCDRDEIAIDYYGKRNGQAQAVGKTMENLLPAPPRAGAQD